MNTWFFGGGANAVALNFNFFPVRNDTCGTGRQCRTSGGRSRRRRVDDGYWRHDAARCRRRRRARQRRASCSHRNYLKWRKRLIDCIYWETLNVTYFCPGRRLCSRLWRRLSCCAKSNVHRCVGVGHPATTWLFENETNRIKTSTFQTTTTTTTTTTATIEESRLTDEVVILSGSELESTGLRCEWAEGDGEVHELVRLVAHGDDTWIGIGYATCVVLFFGYVVDDVLLSVVLVRPRCVHRADDVHLVVLERNVVLVYVDDVVRVVYPESGMIQGSHEYFFIGGWLIVVLLLLKGEGETGQNALFIFKGLEDVVQSPDEIEISFGLSFWTRWINNLQKNKKK